MNTFTDWFTSLSQSAGTNAAIIELLKLYETLTEEEKAGNVIDALQRAYSETGILSLPQVLVKERLRIFNNIRQELQNRLETLNTPMTLSEVSTKVAIYAYVIDKLDLYSADKTNKQLLHKYYFDMASSDEDSIYVLTGAVLSSHMQQSELAVTLINLAGTLCMRVDKRFSLHYRLPTPCNFTYSELYEAGRLLFHGLQKTDMIKILNVMHNTLEIVTDCNLTDFFSGVEHTVCECIDLAKQYAVAAGVIDIRDFDTLESINSGYNKIMYMIGMYAYGVDKANTLAFDIILTLAIQAVLLYGKKFVVNTNFLEEDHNTKSYTDIAKLLFTAED